MPITGELSQQNIKDRYYGVNDPVAMKLLNKAGEMPSLEPPDDESIKTLYVGGLDARITEQDLRDNFYAHGEIESIKMVPQRAIAFVTYTTREGAEKAAEELSNKLVIKGLRLKLMWGRPQAPRPELEGTEEARQQAAVAHGGMLPRAVISQQQNQLHPAGTQDQPPPMHYFNIPPPPQQERTYYPSMDPQRMGAVVPSQDGNPTGPTGSGENRNAMERQQGHYPYQAPLPPATQATQQHQHSMPLPRTAAAGSSSSGPPPPGSGPPLTGSGPPPPGSGPSTSSKQ
ncbi:RNA binding motif protein, putative [Ricinus communis]|uniref:RNA binding motif protein, putative n=1 Tax=Ricinus communis TaxID=3988 RepID=B9S369_RICCO|nr:RNA binding motif protein, putative [Ricinus communis]